MAGNPLTEQQRMHYDNVVYDILREDLIGRNLIALAPGSPFGFGVQEVDYNTLNGMSAAEISWKMSENTDMIGLTNSKLGIPIIHKEWQIDRRDLASSRRGAGTPLDTLGASEAAEQVAISENGLIIQGWSNDGGSTYEVDGLYQAANNTVATSLDFGTAGNATLAVKASMKLLVADKIKPSFNMVLHTDQWTEILGPRSTSSDRTEMDVVKDLLAGGDGSGKQAGMTNNLGGGHIFVSDEITAGTGLIAAAPNPRYADLAVALDATTEYQTLEKSGDAFGRVFEALNIRVRVPNAFCTLTAI